MNFFTNQLFKLKFRHEAKEGGHNWDQLLSKYWGKSENFTLRMPFHEALNRSNMSRVIKLPSFKVLCYFPTKNESNKLASVM